jgi:hypothetical protein
MTDTMTKIIVDCSTNEAVERPMTAEEIAEHELAVSQMAENKALQEAQIEAKEALKASAKAKLIAGEPLTAEEADVLVL